MPTEKQKRAVVRIAENGGNVSRGMQEVGYRPQTAKTPGKLTNSKGWKELMAQHLPDKELAEKHRALLNKREIIVIREGNKSRIELTDQPETQAVSKALDMAYKLKGRYPQGLGVAVQVNIGKDREDYKGA